MEENKEMPEIQDACGRRNKYSIVFVVFVSEILCAFSAATIDINYSIPFVLKPALFIIADSFLESFSLQKRENVYNFSIT